MSKKQMVAFTLMVACTPEGGIGHRGKIPWYLPEDLRYFQQITTRTRDPSKQNAVIMGRKTWESLPSKPLKHRRNVVLTRSSHDFRGMETYGSLDTALSVLAHDGGIERIFVIGGGEVYREAVDHPGCEYAYVTVVDKNDPSRDIPCDTWFPIHRLTQGTDWEMAQLGTPETVAATKYGTNEPVSMTYLFLEYRRSGPNATTQNDRRNDRLASSGHRSEEMDCGL